MREIDYTFFGSSCKRRLFRGPKEKNKIGGRGRKWNSCANTHSVTGKKGGENGSKVSKDTSRKP